MADAEPRRDPIALAEEYALHYPQRAVPIRRNRGLPNRPSFGPPEPDIVQAPVHDRTPALLALDRMATA